MKRHRYGGCKTKDNGVGWCHNSYLSSRQNALHLMHVRHTVQEANIEIFSVTGNILLSLIKSYVHEKLLMNNA